MNKRLFIVRHAKSSWNQPELTDFQRPLNERGKRDVPNMSLRFLEKGYKIDRILSSPAERAITTAYGFAARLNINSEEIIQNESLYHASAFALRRAIAKTPNEIDSLMLFGHNPGLTYLINDISDFNLDNLPTCAVCGIEFNIEQWTSVLKSTGEKFYYDFPKSKP